MASSSPRVIVVTGASVGIGAAILRQQASKGNIVVGLARRVELIEAIKNENKSWKIHALKVDLLKEEDIVKAFDWIKTNLKTIDVLVNNAGVLIPTEILKGNMEDWKTMFGVNVFGVGMCMREGALLLAEDGHIVNIGSIAGNGILPFTEFLIYASTKHALKVINEGVRMSLAKEKPKARVTLIAPGCVETDMTIGFREAGGVLALTADEVAQSVDYAINTPYSCNVTEVVLRPTAEHY